MSNEKATPKQPRKFTLRTVLTVLTLILLLFVIYQNWNDILEAINHLGETNILILILLIPEQLFMYYCCGQMFFSYMAAKKDTKPVSSWTLMRVSLELNFVNHAVPAGGLGGLGYITWRLKPFGATAGQASFMYALRYAITICANQVQTIIAILALLIFSSIPESGFWIVLLTALISTGVIAAIALLVVIASGKNRIKWFAKHATKFCNYIVGKVTFGKHPEILKRATVDKYLYDIHDDLMQARKNKKILLHPIGWGVLYSFLEIATYWIVAASLGHPEILPQIMIGEAIGSVMGSIVPYGLYELGMAGVMVTLGVPIYLATTVVLLTRVIVLASTVVSGYGFYQHSISRIGRQEKAPKDHVE